MAKPTLQDIQAAIEAWDQLLNDNIAILRDGPMPVKEYANANSLPAAASFDRCLAMKEKTGVGWRPSYSDGSAWHYLSDEVIPMGDKSSEARVSGVALSSFEAVGNVGTGKDDLITLSLPANVLNVNNRAIRVKAWGTTANNSNPKTVTLEVGSATILTKALTVSQAGVWEIEAIIMRTSSGHQKYFVRLLEAPGTLREIQQGTTTQVDTSAIAIKPTGEATANDDIRNEGMIVEYLG